MCWTIVSLGIDCVFVVYFVAYLLCIFVVYFVVYFVHHKYATKYATNTQLTHSIPPKRLACGSKFQILKSDDLQHPAGIVGFGDDLFVVSQRKVRRLLLCLCVTARLQMWG